MAGKAGRALHGRPLAGATVLSRDASRSTALLDQLVNRGQLVATSRKGLGDGRAISHLVDTKLAELVDKGTRVVLRATQAGRDEWARLQRRDERYGA